MSTEPHEKPETHEKPRSPIRVGRLAAIVLILVSLAAVVAWQLGVIGPGRSNPPGNAILILAPYRYEGTWVFDDAKTGLVREPFVAGVPEMIDVLVKDIPNADDGFRLLFSARPFPDYHKKLTWLRGDSEGNYYQLDDPPMEGWLCPAMFHYFPDPPKELYVKAEAID